mgnify:CR=1 FL=1|tara:strand:- start:126 stop:302 length:177 start_codon:yes stop_codon:yes gene_type:complete
MNDTIKKKKLTELEVWQIVKEWYLNGMYADILQDEDGRDLEEVVQFKIDSIDNINEIQ